MGQEESRPIDASVAPETLESRTIEAVAELIKAGKVQRIVTMVGAGISTSAGIPDFRSPGTGLYANLARLNLPHAEAVFDISFFRQNPAPFYALAQELYPGRHRPTVTHSFVALLEQKGLLHMHFSQNIDCLERAAGVSDARIVEAHGSFASQRCIECRRPYPHEDMRDVIRTGAVPRCVDAACGGLVKPDIVFFGEALPDAFFRNRDRPAEADLAIVMGSSLSVAPFSSLPGFVARGTPRLLINREQVGGLGSRPDDVLILDDCDVGVRKLADSCGWLEELEALWATTASSDDAPESGEKGEEMAKTKDERLEDEIEKLTKDVEESLKLGKEHTKRLGEEVAERSGAIIDREANRLGPGECANPSAEVNRKTAESNLDGERSALTTPPELPGTAREDGGLDHVFVGRKKSAL